MPYIDKIATTNGTVYDVYDSGARELIDELQQYTDYLGVTTTALTEGATTNPITIGGESVTAKKGNIANYGAKEFIFNGTKWQEFGDLSGLGSLAYKNSASGKFTPQGSISQPTFTGTEKTLYGYFSDVAELPFQYTPAGDVSQPTFTGTQGNVSVSGTVADSVTLSTYTATATGRIDVTPAGEVTQPTFSGTAGNVSVSGTPTGNVTISKGTGTANYTPEGSITVANPTVTLNTTTVPNVTGVGSLPSLSTTVEDHTLKFNWNAGALPTTGTAITVATSVKSATANGGSFTGTGAELKATFAGTAFNSTGTFTPAGTVSQPTFSGTAKYVGATVGTATKTMTGTFTPSGTVSQPTFTGTQVDRTIDVSVGGNVGFKTNVEDSYSTNGIDITPAGTVSQPTFTGTEGDVTVS